MKSGMVLLDDYWDFVTRYPDSQSRETRPLTLVAPSFVVQRLIYSFVYTLRILQLSLQLVSLPQRLFNRLLPRRHNPLVLSRGPRTRSYRSS